MLHLEDYKVLLVDHIDSTKFKNCSRINEEYKGQQLAIIKYSVFEDLVYLKNRFGNSIDWGYLTSVRN